MANIPLKSIKFPDLPNTYVIEPEMSDVQGLEDALNNKANIDGHYDTLGAGTAEQLTSNIYEEDNTPYNFRTSGGSIDIGDREVDKLVGGTVAWNQLAKPLASGNWSTEMNASVTYNDGVATLTPTMANGRLSQPISYTLGHKMLLMADVKLSEATEGNKFTMSVYGFLTNVQARATTDWQTIAGILQVASGNYNWRITITDQRASGWGSTQIKNAVCIDLTQMFGTTIADYIYSLETANAGAGVAWFKKLFPKPYYAYNAGELMSVQVASHDMVGFNQWDEEWELGGIDATTGQNYASSTRLRSKNYIKALPNTVYYFRMDSKYSVTGWFGVMCYDADKNYIDAIYPYVNNTFTTLPNTAYIRFFIPDGWNGQTYTGGICINLHWDGERDGEYEAYDKHSYPLDSSLTLRGIPKLDNGNLYYDGDTYRSDGTVTRNTILRAYQSGDESLANAITDGTNTVVYSANSSTETADPFTNPQIVNDFGTEEYVDYAVSQGNRDVAIPVGHYTQYMANLKAKLEMSPNSPEGAGDYIVRQTNGENEYVTLASNATIQNIIARLEALENAES